MRSRSRGPVVGWKVASLSIDVASIRYRALLPALALEGQGFESRVFSEAGGIDLAGIDVLVIVKGFRADDHILAQQAAEAGIPLVLDLCDNIFIDSYGALPSRAGTSPAGTFLEMARLAQAIVVPTEALAEVVREKAGGRLPVHVIPDGAECQASLAAMRDILAEAVRRQGLDAAPGLKGRARQLARRLKSLRSVKALPLFRRVAGRLGKALYRKTRAIAASRPLRALRGSAGGMAAPARRRRAGSPRRPAGPDAKRILWFGIHGALHARFGMLDLLEIRRELETIAAEFDVELVVVSNSLEKYRSHIEPLAIPSRYLEWSPATLAAQLQSAAVVVIPNSRDPFSICKSANRAVLALSSGVPVVATSTPALAALGDCAILDDFLGGLRLYLSGGGRAALDVERAKARIQADFGPAAIAGAWAAVFEKLLDIDLPRPCPPEAEFIAAFNLPQDLDLGLPIILQARQRGISVAACCNVELMRKSPRTHAALRDHAIPCQLVREDAIGRDFRFPAAARILLTFSESSLGPHRFARRLTEAANAARLVTATVQHGFENIGLTYDDEYQAIDKIDFAAQRIYLWGGLESLHPRTPGATREKCRPVGCPKPERAAMANLDGLVPPGTPIVGVFENLHWRRYSEEYRRFFIENVLAVARAHPGAVFLLKPHHAGLWLTSRYRGDLPLEPNIIIADPQQAFWEQFTAPSLMGHLRAVITTPSTIALDGARHGLPVAVIAERMQLAKYDPLPLVRDRGDWLAYVGKALDDRECLRLADLSKRFVARTTLPGDAARRIVDDLLSA